MPVPLLVFDAALNLVMATDAAFRMWRIRHLPNRPAESLRALQACLDTAPELLERLGATSFRLADHGPPCVQRWDYDGRQFSFHAFSLAVPDTESWIGVMFSEDTDMLRERGQHETTRRYMEIILDSLPLGVAVMDERLQLTYVNMTQRRFLRLRHQRDSLLQLIGAPAAAVFAHESCIPWSELARRLREGLTFRMSTTESVPCDGGERVFSLTVDSLRNEADQVCGAVRVCEDVTGPTRMQAELKHAEVVQARMETMRNMTGTIQHAINNSLTAIVANVDLLLSPSPAAGPGLDEMTAGMLQAVARQAQEIQQFTHDLGLVTAVETTPYLQQGQDQLILVGHRFKDERAAE